MLRVKGNFAGMYTKEDDKFCTLGCKTEENQQHVLQCDKLVPGLEDPSILAEIQYSDIFGTVQEQKLIAQAISELLKLREILLNL